MENGIEVNGKVFAPRPLQSEVIKELRNGFKTYKYVILQMPTGSGKTLPSMVSAIASGGAVYATSDRKLEDKTTDEFEYPNLKGKSAYECNYDHPGEHIYHCENAPCNRLTGFAIRLKWDCIKNNRCTYYNQKAAALASPVTILNHHNAIALCLTGQLMNKKMLVIDEAHRIVEAFRDFLTVRFEKFLDKNMKDLRICEQMIRQIGSVENAVDVIESIVGQIDVLIQSLEQKANPVNRAKIALYSEVLLKLSAVVDAFDSGQEFVFDIDKGSPRLRPLSVGGFARQILDNFDQVLFTSATLFNEKWFLEQMGLANETVFKIEGDSIFAPQNRQIVIFPVARMVANDEVMEKQFPRLVNGIRAILNEHADQKGIIHSVSHKRTMEIARALSDTRRVITHLGAADLWKFNESDQPSVLVSASIKEGVDLPGCGFQIVAKIPFENLFDPLVVKLRQQNSGWYESEAIQSLVQMCGRPIRSEQDCAITYILDSGIKWLLRQHEDYFPAWFLEAISVRPKSLTTY